MTEEKSSNEQEPSTETDPKDDTTQDNQTTDKQEAGETEVTYDLALSEGSLLKEDTLKRVEDFSKSNKLSNEAAKSMLQSQESMIKDYQEHLTKGFDETVKTWEKEVKEDPHLGGDNYQKTNSNIDKFLKEFGSEELSEALQKTGYRNHPDLVRAMNKAGAALGEDTVKFGRTPTGGQPKTMAERWYGVPKS